MSQKKVDDYIEVSLPLDSADVTASETKATYREIKEYILNKFGVKVSSLYISQVKRKNGLEVGECYNKPKSSDAGIWFPAVIAGAYAFLTIQVEDTTIMDFIRYACAYFLTDQQQYEWRYTPDE